MKCQVEEKLLSATRPIEIFTMKKDTLEEEKDEYLSKYKPKSYNTVRNFMITQNVILLYRKALEELGRKDKKYLSGLSLSIVSKDGKKYDFLCHYTYDIRIGKMYVTENNIIYVINAKNKKYYDNYINKTKRFSKVDNNIWEHIKYAFPNVLCHFEDMDSNYCIILKKPCNKIYPLREILNYFEGKIASEYVASILTRLYYFESYMEIIGMNHNAITIDNIFFAPGRIVEEGERFNVEDVRIVGVFGGWFFSTWSYEKLIGIPKEVYEIIPNTVKKSNYSSYEVDELSIKKLAKELLGANLNEDESIPNALKTWVNSKSTCKNAYEEYKSWERVVIDSFGKHRFIDMDVSID